MKDFLREYWLYIVIPVAIVVAGIVVLAVTSEGPGGEFNYNW
jgi:hypothetical protein